MAGLPYRTQPELSVVGTQAAQPAAGSVKITALKWNGRSGPYRLDFQLRAARISVTDAAGSGSSGSLLLFTFNEGVVNPLGCRQDYTAFAEGSALTGGAGDAAFVMALGSAAATAGDGTLGTTTFVNIGSVTGTITLSSGTATATKVSGALAAIDGSATACPVYLNWSGSAATIDANSTIDVTGTISIMFDFLGDD